MNWDALLNREMLIGHAVILLVGLGMYYGTMFITWYVWKDTWTYQLEHRKKEKEKKYE